MRSSILLTILGAGLAIASPLIKKALVTEVVTDVVYEYVTETSSPTTTTPPHTMVVTLKVYPTQVHSNSTSSSSSSTKSTSSKSSTTSTTSTSSTPPPPPPTIEAPAPPTTTTPPPPPPTTTPPPPPPTTEAPAPAPTSAAPAAASSPAPNPAPVDNSGSGLPSGSDFESVVIYQHNVHRQNHSAPDATYDTEMAGYALTVANSCHYAHDRSEGDGNYGQNIAAYGATGDTNVGGAEAIAMAITNMWYNGEVNEYLPSYYGQDNPDMSNFEAWGHFSQVVWKGSTGIGCAAVLCPSGTIFQGFETWFSVCNYYPVGNMGGQYGDNVLPPNGAGTITA